MTLTEDNLVSTAAAAHRRFVLIQDTIGALIEDAWLAYANLDDLAAARFTTAAATIVEGGLRQVADGVSAYTSTSDALLGRARLRSPLATPTIRNGTTLEDVYQRSIIEARRRVAAGESYVDAMRAGQMRAVAAAKTDMSLGNRAAMQQARTGRPWVAGYRRTLTGKSCSFCAMASTQRYTRAELLPLHTSCDCGIAEIYGDTDPGQIINRELLTELKATNPKQVNAPDFGPRPAPPTPTADTVERPSLAVPDDDSAALYRRHLRGVADGDFQGEFGETVAGSHGYATGDFADDPKFRARRLGAKELEDVYAGQPTVNPQQVTDLARSGLDLSDLDVDTPVVIVRVEGHQVIMDGHHRILAAAERGESIEVWEYTGPLPPAKVKVYTHPELGPTLSPT